MTDIQDIDLEALALKAMRYAFAYLLANLDVAAVSYILKKPEAEVSDDDFALVVEAVKMLPEAFDEAVKEKGVDAQVFADAGA